MSLMELCDQACRVSGNWMRQDPRTHWVMSRADYDRIRAEGMTDEQERARAAAHANALISAETQPPYSCPACGYGPFAAMQELGAHIIAMADPQNREPSSRDRLFGFPIEIREGEGEPHLRSAGEPGHRQHDGDQGNADQAVEHGKDPS